MRIYDFSCDSPALTIAFLYACGYTWKLCYYRQLGIPTSFIDFPFPEIIVPNSNLILFLVSLFGVIAYDYYYDYYTKQNRLCRAREIGIDDAIEDVHRYVFQKNGLESQKTNFTVLCEIAPHYFSDNSERQLARENVEKMFSEKFPDIPRELHKAFLAYAFKLLTIDESQRIQLTKDVLGCPPQGFKIYDRYWKIMFFVSVLGLVMLTFYDIFYTIWFVVYLAIGGLAGVILIHASKVSARWQMWHLILVSFMAVFVLHTMHAESKARRDLRNVDFPIATIVQTNGNEETGLLLGYFSEGYFLFANDPNEIYSRKMIAKHNIESLRYTTMRELDRRLKVQMKQFKEEIKELEASTLAR